MVGRRYNLPRVKGRSPYDDVVCRGAIDNRECNIFSDLLRIVSDCYRQDDYAEGIYFCTPKSNKWSVG